MITTIQIVAGTILGAIYWFLCIRRKITVELSAVIIRFLYGPMIVVGFMLFACAFNSELLGKIPNLPIYTAISGIALIYVSISGIWYHILSSKKRDSSKDE